MQERIHNKSRYANKPKANKTQEPKKRPHEYQPKQVQGYETFYHWQFDFHNPKQVAIFFLLTLSGVKIAHQSLAKPATQSLEEKISKKIALDNGGCDAIVKTIVEAVQDQNYDKETLLYTLNQEDFHIKCEPGMGKNLGLALFEPENQAIIFDTKQKLPTYIIRHEFYHAFNFFYHKNGICRDSADKMFATVFPYGEKQIKQYNTAFDKGDARLTRFIDLSLKAREGKLTSKERKLYIRYEEVLKDCHPLTADITITKAQYLKLQKEPKNPFIEIEGNPVKVITLFMDGADYRAEIMTTTAEMLAKLMKNEISKAIIHYNTPAFTDFARISEREAHTFQQLTIKAQQLFYPEAFTLREKYLARCSSNPENKELLPSTPGY